MASCMRCDGCGALRWYGRPLQRELVVEWPGPYERIIFVCEICSEERNIALWPDTWEPYQPTMHPPHRRAQ